MPNCGRIKGKREGSLNFSMKAFFIKKATPIPSQDYDAIDAEMAVKAQPSSNTITFFKNLIYQYEPEMSKVTKQC